MQIVIEIPENYYNAIKEIPVEQSTADMLIIRNGTPLPKGHGRLGDIDALEVYFRNVRAKLNKDDYKTAVEYFTRDDMLLNTEQFIYLVPTIIEADKAESEDKHD